jgi:hypothetical protein
MEAIIVIGLWALDLVFTVFVGGTRSPSSGEDWYTRDLP